MGLRGFFKRVLPAHHVIREHKYLRILGTLLHDPNMFHITRRSAAGGMAIGLFIAFMPLPAHMLIAAILAIYLRVNLPLAVVLVWLTNPFTIAPYLYLAYKTGSLILNVPAHPVDIELNFTWAGETLLDIWQPLLLGCLTYSTVTAVLGYGLVRWLWRFATIRKWEERKKLKLKNSGNSQN